MSRVSADNQTDNDCSELIIIAGGPLIKYNTHTNHVIANIIWLVVYYHYIKAVLSCCLIKH